MKQNCMKPILIISLFFLFAFHVDAQTKTFTIPYESKGYNVTMTYNDIIHYCRLTDSLYNEVVFKSFGKSAQGDDLPYLIIDDGSKTADKITLWIQAGIHPGEPEGVEAGFLFRFGWGHGREGRLCLRVLRLHRIRLHLFLQEIEIFLTLGLPVLVLPTISNV